MPQLAIAWKIVAPTIWDFELRRGVSFHDGTPFTADDVVFSLERARAATSDFRDYVDGIAAVVAIDDLTVRVTTTRPDPSLWLKLAEVAIMSRAWAEAHGVHVPANVKAGEETFASRHANGTGPFRLEASSRTAAGSWCAILPGGVRPTSRTTSTASFTSPNATPRTSPPCSMARSICSRPCRYWAVDQIRSNPDLKLVYGPKLLTLFFGLDQGSAELRSSNIKGRNPFKDKRVREAMAYAMDLKSALHDLMGDLFIPAGMLAAPGVNGYSPDWISPRFAILRSRRRCSPRPAIRMASASPSIARTIGATTRSPNARPPPGNSPPVESRSPSISVAQDEYDAKVSIARQSDFRLDGMAHGSGFRAHSERIVSESGKWNLIGYANPRVDELLDKIDGEMVTYARDAYLEEAWKIVTDDFVYLPIRHGVSVFAMRRNSRHPARSLGRPALPRGAYRAQRVADAAGAWRRQQ